MFFSRESQNWLLDLFSIRVLETLPPPATLLPVLPPLPLLPPGLVLIWVLVDIVSVTLRPIFT